MITTKRFFATFSIYLFISFYACVMTLLRPILTGNPMTIFLVWNLFLAWIPFVLSGIIYLVYINVKSRLIKCIVCIPCGILWFLFFPNAPYMLTDFTHFSQKTFYAGINDPILVAAWYDFLMYSLFILTGFMLGYVSLYILQNIVQKIFNFIWGWVFAFMVILLSSYAIYLGRFIRLNSWDVWHNMQNVTESVLSSLTFRNFCFTVLFSMFLFMFYLGFVCVVHLKQTE